MVTNYTVSFEQAGPNDCPGECLLLLLKHLCAQDGLNNAEFSHMRTGVQREKHILELLK